MTIRDAFAALALTLTVLGACANAAPHTPAPAERAAIKARVAQFSSDFRRGRTAAVVDLVPSKGTAELARRSGIPLTDLRRTVIDQTKTAMKLVKVVSYKMDADQAVFLQSTAGRGDALIPSQTVVRGPNGQTIQYNNITLAFADGGKWYLGPIDDAAQRGLLVDAHPEFSGLRVADGTTKVIG